MKDYPVVKELKSVVEVEELEKLLKEKKKELKKAEKQKGIDIIKDTLKLGGKVFFKLKGKTVEGIVYSVSLGNSIQVQYKDTKGKDKVISRAIINLPTQTKK